MADGYESVPVVMTIAGSDSGGGAGIQADLKTFTALGCYGTSVVTALTAQNTQGVQGVHAIPPAFVEQQLTSVLSDIAVKAFKTGMLANAGVTATIAHTLRTSNAAPISLVCDPVCVSTSGHTLLEPDALATMVRDLFPLAALITPNKAEAELLISHTHPERPAIRSLDDMVGAAHALLELGPRAVLLKGGHLTVCMADARAAMAARPEVVLDRTGLLTENMEILLVVERDPEQAELVADVLCEAVEGGAVETTVFLRPRLESTSTHGTGCTLSAAIACGLARGETVVDAVRTAAAYTHDGIAASFPIAATQGHGPLNHMHPILRRSIPRPTESNPHPFVRLLIRKHAGIWKDYVQHDFVRQLGEGTLAKEHFVHFIKQDYLYLKYYARAHGLLAAKSPEYDKIAASAEIMLHIIRESTMHRTFCAQWGVSPEELDSTPESPACTAYGAYILDIGLRGDASQLLMALAACLLGYGEVGLWLRREAARLDSWVKLAGNPYHKWIEDYSGADYQAAVKVGIERIEEMAQDDPPSPKRFQEWSAVWEKCTRLEKGFWDMAMTLS
ncbi:hypothetical protein FA95DRAFT_1547085 [Auriscalpium vulgare]|uniref:Uncharacterized protein n=1 Tax=Auriscalpium vulgare TaxID=40419 RepID=A0ACB8RG09_9AGAM|nr:hypothetical protein FA95DRAFT_1547085 [Auriscalpium vulgare]